jgi:hypothetical protein
MSAIFSSLISRVMPSGLSFSNSRMSFRIFLMTTGDTFSLDACKGCRRVVLREEGTKVRAFSGAVCPRVAPCDWCEIKTMEWEWHAQRARRLGALGRWGQPKNHANFQDPFGAMRHAGRSGRRGTGESAPLHGPPSPQAPFAAGPALPAAESGPGHHPGPGAAWAVRGAGSWRGDGGLHFQLLFSKATAVLHFPTQDSERSREGRCSRAMSG